MTGDTWYWLIMFLWTLAMFWSYRVPGQPYPWERALPAGFLTFLLFLIIGFKVFGSPYKG